MSQLALVDQQALSSFSSGINILSLGNERIRINETYAQGFHIPWSRLQNGPPIRIGRSDAPQDELPIYPEIDLSPVMPTNQQGCVSRLQAALEWQNDKPMLRTTSRVSGTWIRRSGENRIALMRLHDYLELKDGDILYLGHPKKIYVRLRIRFQGSRASTP